MFTLKSLRSLQGSEEVGLRAGVAGVQPNLVGGESVCTCGTGVTLQALKTLFTLKSLRSLQGSEEVVLRAGVAGVQPNLVGGKSVCTCGTGVTLQALKSLRSLQGSEEVGLRAGVSGVQPNLVGGESVRACGTSGTLFTLRTGGTLFTLRTSGTLFTLRTSGTLRALRTGRTLRAFAVAGGGGIQSERHAQQLLRAGDGVVVSTCRVGLGLEEIGTVGPVDGGEVAADHGAAADFQRHQAVGVGGHGLRLHIHGGAGGTALQDGNLHPDRLCGHEVVARVTHHSLVRELLRSLGKCGGESHHCDEKE